MRQRCVLVALLALLEAISMVRGLSGDTQPGGAPVTVVAITSIEAHRVAIEGIREALANTFDVRVVDLGRQDKGQSKDRLAVPGTRVIIAVGSEALQLVAAERPVVPVVSTFVLRRKPVETLAVNPVSTISLDIPLPILLTRLKQVFPGKTRLGIVRNPNAGGSAVDTLEGRAQSGFTIRVVDSPNPQELLEAVVKLKGKVDFLWCLPDGVLYNDTTIKPLILASLETRLPLIGFSQSFARAGAALSVYPDFRDVGLQTGEAAQQIISGQKVHSLESPRKLKLVVNQSVLRLLGLRYNSPAEGAEDFSVLP